MKRPDTNYLDILTIHNNHAYYVDCDAELLKEFVYRYEKHSDGEKYKHKGKYYTSVLDIINHLKEIEEEYLFEMNYASEVLSSIVAKNCHDVINTGLKGKNKKHKIDFDFGERDFPPITLWIELYGIYPISFALRFTK